MKLKIANGILTTFGILLLICSITFTVFAYVGQVPFLRTKNNIVANAATINGVEFPTIDVENYLHVNYTPVYLLGELQINDGLYRTTVLNAYSEELQLLPFNTYYIEVYFSDYDLFAFFVPTDNHANIGIYQVVSTFVLSDYDNTLDPLIYAYILFNTEDLEYTMCFSDPYEVLTTTLYIDIYSVPTNNTESTTTESLTEILGNSINFSTSAITTSVKEVFEGLFVNENNTISNYATYVVWFSGIAIALGFFKYILRFILTMGDKK